MIRLRAPAKLNLTLDVVGRRPDGYHELRSILQTISLADEVRVAPNEDLKFTCSDPALAGLDNLVWRAATLLRDEAGIREGAAIELDKRVPAAAGLGGGSSDAAAALVGLARLWRLDWPLERLAALAASLGSDVPFFLWGGTALAEGRGERIRPLPPLAGLWFVLLPASAREPDKTRRIFAALPAADYSRGEATARIEAQLLAGRVDPADFANDLTATARRLFPDIERPWTALTAIGAQPHLSGAGPSVFAATADRGEADRWAERLGAAGFEALVVAPLSSGR
jgi:4-diphosphocytidyl-2-C-methyl-D-erythritol kinase